MKAAISGIDHTLVGVGDLEDAKRAWRRLGFAPCPRGRHIGWGTANYCIMFPDAYIELLGIIDPSQFTNNLDSFLEEREGLLGLAFAGPDAEAASRTIPGAEAPKVLKRVLEGPEGEQLPEFALVHYPAETTPALRSFFCHHETPEIVWRPDWLQHPNKVTGLVGVTAVVEDPGALAGAYEALFGGQAIEISEGRLQVETGRGRLSFLNQEAFASAYGSATALPCANLPCLAVMHLGSADLNATEGYLDRAGVSITRSAPHSLLVPASEATGVILEIAAADGPIPG